MAYMNQGRKTFEVGTLLCRLNHFLASVSSTAEEREVMCDFVENILFDTGNYMGYRYLSTDEVAGNGSRRYYFVSPKIQDHYAAAEKVISGHYCREGVGYDGTPKTRSTENFGGQPRSNFSEHECGSLGQHHCRHSSPV